MAGYGPAVMADAALAIQAAPRVERWGVVGYEAALARQLELHGRRLEGQVADTLVVVEHPPTITLGRHAPSDDVLADASELRRRGITVARSDRGGRATYHGPGQVVLYPIVSIEELGIGVRDWVCLLEGALLDTLADYAITGERHAGTAGIWTSQGKIASIGLRIARGVSYHGVALNVSLDASVFDCIVTCGVGAERVTTISAMTGTSVSCEQASERLIAHTTRRMQERRASCRA
ncbi:MAG TPA: lipoyl(octanoyl) transferase LipB [Candidatus Binatia bacterium]|nr:lipoyl(octanoyl) transferase LipB [Candidatus Binatia bacterium]